MMSARENNLIIKLPQDTSFLEEMENILKIQTYLTRKAGTIQTEEIEVQGEMKDVFPRILFSSHLNRDTLSRILSQKEQMKIDILMSMFTADMYASLLMAINKDEPKMEELHQNIQTTLNDFKNIQKELFNYKGDEKCH